MINLSVNFTFNESLKKHIRMEESNYIIDKKGKKIAVQIPIKVYNKLIAESEELYEIKEYRKAKKHKGDAIPLEQAFKELED